MSLRRLALGTLLGAFEGASAPPWVRALTAEGLAGQTLFAGNVDDPDQLAELCAALHAERPGTLIAIDEEGGDVTRLGHRAGSPYPGNAALGVADDIELTRAVYAAIGADLARAGVDLDLAPTVDVNSTAANPVIGTRSFGADPALVARHTAAAVAGLQDAGVAACAKHFPGHGATVADSHLELPTVDATPELMAVRDLPPFTAAVTAGTKAVMTAHIRIPSITGAAPATFSPAALGILRNQIGYGGVIVTDALEMQGAARYSGGSPNGAVLALAAGADLLCIGSRVTPELVEAVVAAIVAAVEDGRLPQARLEEAAARVTDLGSWIATARSGQPAAARPERFGIDAARRAVRVDGTLPDLTGALVVQLEAGTTIAQGRVPWGLGPHIAAPVRRVAVESASLDDIRAEAAGRPIVVAGRNLHRLPGARDLIEALASGDDDVTVLEMGWPGEDRPRGIRSFVTTHGASRANGRAAAEALSLATT